MILLWVIIAGLNIVGCSVLCLLLVLLFFCVFSLLDVICFCASFCCCLMIVVGIGVRGLLLFVVGC